MIFVSAGHHQEAKGATFGDFNEYDEAQIWKSLILSGLGDLGMAVPSGVLNQKTTFINSWSDSPSDIAIEIHFNAAKDKNSTYIGQGCETLYYPGSKRGKAAGEAIQEALAPIFPPNRGAKEGYYRMDRKNGVDWFLKKTVCTALIIEPEFIHHKHKIQGDRGIACKSIANTLIDFVNTGGENE